MQRLRALIKALPFTEWRVLRFLISGGISATTNFATLYILTEFFDVWYLLSSVIALVLSLIVSFLLQKFWTFQNYSLERVHIQVPLHATLALCNLVFNTIALYVLVEWFGVWYMFGQVINGMVIAAVNYYMYRTHIFV